jgi:hypothetical protein
VAASLLLSTAGGAGLAWARIKKQARAPSVAVSATDVDSVEALFSKQKHEQFLKDVVDSYAEPGKDPTKIRNGVNHCVELGLLYLEQWRLDQADALFSRLMQSSVDQYVGLGRLGHAIVLGLQNKPAESNKAFLDALKHLNWNEARPRQALNRFESPQLVQWVARALDYNAANATAEAPFPQRLTPLRTPFGGRRGGTEKESGTK